MKRILEYTDWEKADWEKGMKSWLSDLIDAIDKDDYKKVLKCVDENNISLISNLIYFNNQTLLEHVLRANKRKVLKALLNRLNKPCRGLSGLFQIRAEKETLKL